VISSGTGTFLTRRAARDFWVSPGGTSKSTTPSCQSSMEGLLSIWPHLPGRRTAIAMVLGPRLRLTQVRSSRAEAMVDDHVSGGDARGYRRPAGRGFSERRGVGEQLAVGGHQHVRAHVGIAGPPRLPEVVSLPPRPGTHQSDGARSVIVVLHARLNLTGRGRHHQ
jgi:hypothetical protein